MRCSGGRAPTIRAEVDCLRPRTAPLRVQGSSSSGKLQDLLPPHWTPPSAQGERQAEEERAGWSSAALPPQTEALRALHSCCPSSSSSPSPVHPFSYPQESDPPRRPPKAQRSMRSKRRRQPCALLGQTTSCALRARSAGDAPKGSSPVAHISDGPPLDLPFSTLMESEAVLEYIVAQVENGPRPADASGPCAAGGNSIMFPATLFSRC